MAWAVMKSFDGQDLGCRVQALGLGFKGVRAQA